MSNCVSEPNHKRRSASCVELQETVSKGGFYSIKSKLLRAASYVFAIYRHVVNERKKRYWNNVKKKVTRTTYESWSPGMQHKP